jgi:hypothetical protein
LHDLFQNPVVSEEILLSGLQEFTGPIADNCAEAVMRDGVDKWRAVDALQFPAARLVVRSDPVEIQSAA